MEARTGVTLSRLACGSYRRRSPVTHRHEGTIMGNTFRLAALVAALVAFAVPAAVATAASSAAADGTVYTLTNSATGNGVAASARRGRHAHECRHLRDRRPRHGSNLGSQGAVVLSDNGKHLFAVNAGSNSISEFSVKKDGSGSRRRSPRTASCRSASPQTRTSCTSSTRARRRSPASRSTATGAWSRSPVRRSRSSAPPPPRSRSRQRRRARRHREGQRHARHVRVRGDVAQPGVSSPSAGATPFGFAFDGLGRAFVSEAAGSASSYAIDAVGAQVISGAVATHQGARAGSSSRPTAGSRTPRTRAERRSPAFRSPRPAL